MSTNYTITNNAKYKSIEIKFDGKPVESVRTMLKEHHFRWNNPKGIWYGYMDKAEMEKLLGKSVKIDTSAPKAKPKKESTKKTATKVDESVSLFGDDPVSDTVTYYRAVGNGKYEKRTGKSDLASGTVIEKIDTVYVATDYLSGARVAMSTTKKSLMETLSSLTEKIATVRTTDKYKALCDALSKYENHVA